MHLIKGLGLASVTASITGAFAWYHSSDFSTAYEILDPRDVVRNLNTNRDVRKSIEALEALEDLHLHQLNQSLHGLDVRGWCQLALHRSRLFRQCPPLEAVGHRAQSSGESFAALMKKVELNRNWSKALSWYFTNVCAEDDLICHETQEPERSNNSKRKRIHKILQVLLYVTEFEDCTQVVKQRVPEVLLKLFEEYREDRNVELVVLLFKVLANMAGHSWLQMLGSMSLEPVMKVEPLLARKVLHNMMYSMGAAGHRMPADLYEFYSPDGEPQMDVVFVHGFRGSVFRTWRQKDLSADKTSQFWPMDWLPDDLHAPVRLIGIDYQTKLLSFGKFKDSIVSRSKAFQEALREVGVGQRPLFFVCHSMGGLLVKQLLIDNPDLLRRTVGIVFMATPHRGSPVVAYVHHILRPTEDLKLLHIDSAANKSLYEQFLAVSDSIPVIESVLENRLTPFFGTERFIVPTHSGAFGRGRVYHADEHHHNVCKPASREALSYCVTVNAVKDALKIST